MAPDDLTYRESCAVIDQLAVYAPLTLVWNGGEPLWRRDIFDLAHRARSKGLRVVIASNGTLVDEAVAGRLMEAGVERVCISLDGPDAATHDNFRGQEGAFDAALRGLRCLQQAGISAQINTTVTRHNAHQLESILNLAEDLPVDAFHLFLLVPVGCGLTIPEEEAIRGAEAEEILTWFYRKSQGSRMELKATCAPHYYRIVRQQRAAARSLGTPLAPLPAHGIHAMAQGCLAGSGVCFLSHQGEVYPCGYLPVSAGNLREDSFREIWEHSVSFGKLRGGENPEGKCGICELQNGIYTPGPAAMH